MFLHRKIKNRNTLIRVLRFFVVVPPVMSHVYLRGIRWSYIYFISANYKNFGVVWSTVDVDGFKRVK
jgi:hypothetical protein